MFHIFAMPSQPTSVSTCCSVVANKSLEKLCAIGVCCRNLRISAIPSDLGILLYPVRRFLCSESKVTGFQLFSHGAYM